VTDNKIEYPVAVDTAGKTWQAWGNRYWPSVYLIDKRGNVRYRWDGELNWKGVKGEKLVRERIEQLLAEKDPEP
jgi:predicted transcriptional regulator